MAVTHEGPRLQGPGVRVRGVLLPPRRILDRPVLESDMGGVLVNRLIAHQKAAFQPGDVVLVEGVVNSFTPGTPYAEVVVAFPFATDDQYLLDGVTCVLPQVSVVGCCCYSDDGSLRYYLSEEGFYPEGCE